MRNVLFVLYHDFSCNSAAHVHSFANHLAQLGYRCVVAVPENKQTAARFADQRYSWINFAELEQLPQLFGDGRGPDVVHGWTPREVVRLFCARLRHRYSFRLFVHLEDNEEYLLEKFLGRPPHMALALSEDEFPHHLSHPRRYKEFLDGVDGVTVIIDELKAFVPAGRPTLTLWPSSDPGLYFPQERDEAFAQQIGLPVNATVLCYTGNAHVANAHELRSLYLAVAILNREGMPATLVRTGRDFYEFLGENDSWARKYALELGLVENACVPRVLALADLLVQPGRADRFNEYRFPSKLPEFLAMGRPVVLPRTNVGKATEHLRHAYVLPVADALSIAHAVRTIRADPELAARLGRGAREFAQAHLNWGTNAEKLAAFYTNPESAGS